jgi:hypothetical protein
LTDGRGERDGDASGFRWPSPTSTEVAATALALSVLGIDVRAPSSIPSIKISLSAFSWTSVSNRQGKSHEEEKRPVRIQRDISFVVRNFLYIKWLGF